MNTFLNTLEDNNNFTETENGATANRSTKSKCLDLFALGGALREKSQSDIVGLFNKAYSESDILALKMMFYFRDVRGGQGQREAFRFQLVELAHNNPAAVLANLKNIPQYGRWDDLFVLLGTPVEKEVLALIKEQFITDLKLLNSTSAEDKTKISLLGKWMKSENTSSQESRKIAHKVRKYLNLTEKQYRKSLSALRKHLKIVERDISSNKWDKIDYSHVPSQAGMQYRNAFMKHDEERYTDFIEKVNSGEAKINAGTLYPHEIIGKILDSRHIYRGQTITPEVAQAYWDNLPDYVAGNKESSIAVVDTSGSMQCMGGLPLNVAISLGLYMSERASGPFKDHFITFSESPELQKITGKNITDRVLGMSSSKWGMNTNLERVFNLILKTALNNNVAAEDVPKKLYVISDMQFDRCMQGPRDKTFFNNMKDRFAANGLEMPKVVFWNVNARADNVPATMSDEGVQLVSGFSPSIFQYLMTGEFKSPYELMIDVLNSERYADVVVHA